jgi:hypothetical protein
MKHLFQVLAQSDAVLARYPRIYVMILEPMLCSALQYRIYKENVKITAIPFEVCSKS